MQTVCVPKQLLAQKCMAPPHEATQGLESLREFHPIAPNLASPCPGDRCTGDWMTHQTEKPGVTNQPTNQPSWWYLRHKHIRWRLLHTRAPVKDHYFSADTLLEGCRRLNKWCRPLHPWTPRLPHWDRRFGDDFVFFNHPFLIFINQSIIKKTYPMYDHERLLCSLFCWPLNKKTFGLTYPAPTPPPTVAFVSGTSSGIPSNQGSSPPLGGLVSHWIFARKKKVVKLVCIFF